MRLTAILPTLALLLTVSFSHAEVIELEGTVKAVDADARTISIERKTSKGTKTLELEVTKKAGDLSSVKVGDHISFSYDPGLELVTKLGSSGDEDASADLKALQGKWVATTIIVSGNKVTKGEMQRHSRTVTIEDNTYTETIFRDGKVFVVKGEFTIDPKARAFDFNGETTDDKKATFSSQWTGIYERDGDKVKLTYRKKLSADTERPKKFGEGDQGKAWTNSFILERDE